MSRLTILIALAMSLAFMVVGAPIAPAQRAEGDPKLTPLRADRNHLLKRNNTSISPAQLQVLAKSRQSPETVAIDVMRAPEASGDGICLDRWTGRWNVPHRHSYQRRSADHHRPHHGRQDRQGRDLERDRRGGGTAESAVLQWWKDGRLTGEFSYKGHIYIVMNMGGDLHAVLEVDPKMLPPDHPRPRQGNVQTQPSAELTLPKIEPISPADLKALEAKTIVIDVMMLYTKRAASHYMRDPEDMLEFAIERVNESFRNSGLGNISLRLVHAQAVDYDERGSDEFTDLYHVVDGDDPFKDVRRLRNLKRADIVGMIVDDPTGCGLSTRVAPDSEEAYFVVHYACAAITISIAHEIGHILGARHDRRIDPSNKPFPYGHGYVNGTKWRDIMSYQESCDGCPRIPFWSNPRVLYKGEPTGTLTEDNARVILEQAERVSNFR